MTPEVALEDSKGLAENSRSSIATFAGGTARTRISVSSIFTRASPTVAPSARRTFFSGSDCIAARNISCGSVDVGSSASSYSDVWALPRRPALGQSSVRSAGGRGPTRRSVRGYRRNQHSPGQSRYSRLLVRLLTRSGRQELTPGPDPDSTPPQPFGAINTLDNSAVAEAPMRPAYRDESMTWLGR